MVALFNLLAPVIWHFYYLFGILKPYELPQAFPLVFSFSVR